MAGPIGGVPAKPIVVTFFGNPMIWSDGCHTRVLGVLHFLSSAGFDLTFYSFRDYPVWPWSDHHVTEFKSMFPSVQLVLDRWSRGANFIRRAKNAVCSFMPKFSAAVVRLTVPGIMPEWSGIKRKHPNAMYLVNYVDGLTQLNGIDLGQAIVETHDLLFRGYGLLHNKSIWCWSMVWRFRREFSLLDATAIVIAVAQNEQVLFEQMLTGPTVCYVPPHIEPVGNPDETAIPTKDILFLGSANEKNIRGINSFLAEYRKWQALPRVLIAGNVSDHVDHKLSQSASIEVRGYVQDLSSLYRSVRAVICPVEGTGVNIKMMEALAYGKPVFACSSAIAALPPGSESCVFPLTEESVRALLADSGRF